mmetsp:Transcript_21069/g.66770  ORF Transcript_21069/g.66770 Transcript_21069/m.66770 type:complete len:473 (+) Transcript_21069:339-1757(+)|eukprot:CAMPEP_0182861074 /NCGR_PEP_ID=MMETSP0034_2-20130328/5284_1 /TAXON_ID=156128 /ORGANISM="Nephroselmis pyriformis, Strain CCMP717" /LENGTH=472 /DNA_ID=CAMNT_0024992963 /DNA_START=371 /DNA_END=1789 /DNA_ORIENTATION=-
MSVLMLKRVPTLISLSQEEADSTEASATLAARQAAAAPAAKISACGQPGVKVPVLRFYASNALANRRVRSFGAFGDDQRVPDVEDNDSGSDSRESGEDDGTVLSKSSFDMITLASWEEKAEQGLFRYDVTACPTKVLRGAYGFIAQCNVGRATQKRATEFRIDQVIQDFDDSKFNFTKASTVEVLFDFRPTKHKSSVGYAEAEGTGASPHLVLINVSPIEYGHILLVPNVNDKLPQALTPNTMLLALNMAAEAANPYFRVGFNSLGAYATINHLHFQAYYLASPFPVERAHTVTVQATKKRRLGVMLGRLAEFPVRGLVYEMGDGTLDALAAAVGGCAAELSRRNIPFNVLICDRGARVFVFPQCYAERQAKGEVEEKYLETGVNPAVFEIAGHIVLKKESDYENMSQSLAWDLLAQVSLSEAKFREVEDIAVEALFAAVNITGSVGADLDSFGVGTPPREPLMTIPSGVAT